MKKKSVKVRVASGASQYCINVHYFDELMQLPNTVEIHSVQWEVGTMNKKTRMAITEELAQLGVTHMRQVHSTQNVEGGFKSMSRNQMTQALGKICDMTGNSEHRVRIKSVVLKTRTCQATFRRIVKEVLVGDVLRKIVMLGLAGYVGNPKELNNLLAEISAENYTCKIDYITTRNVICQKGA